MNLEVASALLRNEEFRRLCDTSHFKLTGNRIFVNDSLAAVFEDGALTRIYSDVSGAAYRTAGDKSRVFELTYRTDDDAGCESTDSFDMTDRDWDIDVRNREIVEYDEPAKNNGNSFLVKRKKKGNHCGD
jgi:hypothetical protein